MKTPLIEFKDVTKRFGSKTVLDRVNLQIYEGEVTTIIGLSGSGKSVMLKHIIGLLKPDEGAIYFRGRPLAVMNKKELAKSFASISYMFQGNALFDSMTVYDNIALPLRETTDLKKMAIDRKVMARVKQTELTEAIHKYPSELSGGMQKRAALARALITDPQIVLFDEPTTGQDPVRKNAILSMIAQYQKKLNFTACWSVTRYRMSILFPTVSWLCMTARLCFRERPPSLKISIIHLWMRLSAAWRHCKKN